MQFVAADVMDLHFDDESFDFVLLSSEGKEVPVRCVHPLVRGALLVRGTLLCAALLVALN